LIVVLIFSLIGCSKDIPKDKQDFIGEWRGDGVFMRIYSSGKFVYSRRNGSSRVSINSYISEFNDDGFKVNVLIVNTGFKVTMPPKEVNGSWVMVVDGVRLIKQEQSNFGRDLSVISGFNRCE